MKYRVTITAYLLRGGEYTVVGLVRKGGLYLSGTAGGEVKKSDTKMRPSTAMKRNWKKVTVFPAPVSSLHL